MAMKAAVADLDEIAEPLREHYKETTVKGPDQKETKIFVLETESGHGFGNENVGALKRSLERAKDERKTLADQVKVLDGIEDLDAVLAAAAKWDEVKDLDPDAEADRIANSKIEGWKAQIKEEHEKETTKFQGKIDRYAGKIGEMLIDSVAVREIADAKGSPDLLLPIVKQMCRWREDGEGNFVVEVLNAEGQARVGDAEGNPFTIGQLVSELRESEKYGRAFDGSGSGGSGADAGGQGGGGGKKPPIGAVRSRKDLTDVAAKSKFIEDHGLKAYEELPAE